MGIMTLVGDDSLVINDYPIHTDFQDGDTCTIDFPNDLFSMATGKNKNTIYAKNEAGSNFSMTFSIGIGGKVDKFLNGLRSQQESDFVRFTLMNGAFTKVLGDGEGNVTYNQYILLGMMFKKMPGAKGNSAGDTEQGKVTYVIDGAVATRGLT
jgi:hypothetical protein